MKRIVGLDIGATEIRAVQIRDTKAGLVVEKAASAPLPAGWVQSGMVNNVAGVSDTLRDMWKRNKFATKDVALGVINSRIVIRQWDLPWMPEREFRNALPFRVREGLRQLSGDDDLTLVDFVKIDDFETLDDNQQVRKMVRVLVAAAPEDVVSGLAEAANTAGLTPIRADLIPFALIRLSARTLAAHPENEPLEALVDLGADTTSVIIHQGGQPRFVRPLPNVGGQQLVTAVSEAFSLTVDQALEQVLSVGVAINADSSSNPVYKIVNPWAAELIQELRNSVHYFLSDFDDSARITRIVLTGNGAYIPGMPSRIQSELQVPVVVADPLSELASGPRLTTPQSRNLAVATGLAIGA